MKNTRRFGVMTLGVAVAAGLAAFGTVTLVRAAEAAGPAAGAVAEAVKAPPSNALYYAVALTVGLACLGAGYAVGKVGSAAMGVLSEKPELFGRVLIFVALAEGIAIYGVGVAVLLLFR